MWKYRKEFQLKQSPWRKHKRRIEHNLKRTTSGAEWIQIWSRPSTAAHHKQRLAVDRKEGLTLTCVLSSSFKWERIALIQYLCFCVLVIGILSQHCCTLCNAFLFRFGNGDYLYTGTQLLPFIVSKQINARVCVWVSVCARVFLHF